MKAMVGFKNITVHDYQAINQDILQQILDKHLSDFTTYTKQILYYGLWKGIGKYKVYRNLHIM